MSRATLREDLHGNPNEMPNFMMVAWNVSPICNLACRHCYLGKLSGKDFLTREELAVIIEKVEAIGVETVFLAGGEPLMHPEIEYVVSEFVRRGIRVYLNTNGLLLSDEQIKALVRLGLVGVIFGFDGVHRETYERIRGANTYDRVLDAILRSLKSGLSVEVDFTLNSINADELLILPQWGEQLGVKRITLKRYVPRPQSSFDQLLRLNAEQLREIYHRFLEDFPDPSKREACKILAHDPLFLVAKAEMGVLHADDIYREDCNAGGYTRGWFGISSRGELHPCPVMTEMNIGNVLNEELQSMVRHPEMTAARDIIPMLCLPCPYVSFCRGGCRASKLRLGLRLEDPDPCCWRVHR